MNPPAAAPPLPLSSLIICSRNRQDMLGDTVRSVLRGTELPTEIVVVDQSDRRAESLPVNWRHPQCDVRYVWTPEVGLSRANNLGVLKARYDLLVFTHDDVLVTPAWFGTLVQALLTAGPRSVVTGKVPPGEPELPGGFQQTVRVLDSPVVWQRRTRLNPLLVLNMALHRSAVDDVGGFDVRLGPGTPFPGAEDVDLGFRLLEAGYRIVYSPEAVLYHRAWRTPQSYLPLRWGYGVALGAFFAKHLTLRDRWIARTMLGVLRHRSFRACRTLVREPRRALGDIISVAGILTGVGHWWRMHGSRRGHDRSPSE